MSVQTFFVKNLFADLLANCSVGMFENLCVPV